MFYMYVVFSIWHSNKKQIIKIIYIVLKMIGACM